MRIPIALLSAAMFWVPIAAAHDIHIFATLKGEELVGRVTYEGDLPAPGLTVVVLDGDGAPLGSTKADENGDFVFTPKPDTAHVFIAETPDGHRASTVVYMGSSVPDIKLPPNESVASPAPDNEDAIMRLQQQVDRLEQRIGLQDVIGGIGYIVGILGLIAFWKARASRNSR